MEFSNERHAAIVDIVSKNHFVTVKDLAKTLGVSEMTIQAGCRCTFREQPRQAGVWRNHADRGELKREVLALGGREEELRQEAKDSGESALPPLPERHHIP